MESKYAEIVVGNEPLEMYAWRVINKLKQNDYVYLRSGGKINFGKILEIADTLKTVFGMELSEPKDVIVSAHYFKTENGSSGVIRKVESYYNCSVCKENFEMPCPHMDGVKKTVNYVDRRIRLGKSPYLQSLVTHKDGDG